MNGTKCHVLLVDDNDLARKAAANVMLYLGWEVRDFSSAIEALAVIVTVNEFDLVVSDCKMPTMNGAEFFSEVRRLVCPTPPLIAYSGATEIEGSMLPYCDAFIPKPFDVDTLIHAVDKAKAQKSNWAG